MIDYKNELNEEQYRVVTEGDGPCLVLAGAGSGKTRAITYRVAYLLERGVAPENILLLTFTNKAADEMLRRVGQLAGAMPHGLWGGTFHSIGYRILRQYAARLGYRQDFSILDASDSKDLTKICMKEEGAGDTKSFPGPGTVHGIISFAVNAQISIDEVLDWKYPQHEKYGEQFRLIADRYEQKKRTAQVMDFDDLLLNVVRLFDQHTDIRDHYAEQFKYVLVDEYQDTNALQSRLVNLVSAKHRNILVVGDDAQSIYSFRAADIDNILSFEKRYPDAKIFKLETNYRSTPEILDFANEVIGNNKKQYKKELRTPGGLMGTKPELKTFSDTAEEAREIARHMLDLKRTGTVLANIAVLFRSSFHSQELEMELARNNIPYDYRGGLRFFERAHVKDVLAYLRLAHNPKDTMAWMRVLYMYDGIGPQTAAKIVERVVEIPDLKSVDTERVAAGLPARANAGWQQFAVDMARLRDVPERTPAMLINAVLASSYKDILEKEHEDHKERMEDLEQMARFAERVQDLGNFLGEATLTESHSARLARDTATKDEPRVVLSTIHQAKGLEWDVVFILRMAAGMFPNERALSNAEDIEEERRLFYVAATRARRELYLCYPLMAGGENSYLLQPSPFIQELPKEVFKEVDADEPRYVSEEAPARSGKPPWAREFLKSIDELE